jgi:hypothetical protein
MTRSFEPDQRSDIEGETHSYFERERDRPFQRFLDATRSLRGVLQRASNSAISSGDARSSESNVEATARAASRRCCSAMHWRAASVTNVDKLTPSRDARRLGWRSSVLPMLTLILSVVATKRALHG